MNGHLFRKVLTVHDARGSHQQTYYVKPPDQHPTLRLRSGEKQPVRPETVHPSERIQVHYGLLWSGRANKGVDETIRAVGTVHTVPKGLMRVPISVTGSLDGSHGLYEYQGRGGGPAISVSKYCFGPAGTVAHEYGHFLDHHLFGTGEPRLRGMATCDRRNKEVAPLMEALYRSKACKQILDRHEEHVRNGEHHRTNTTEYLLMPPEMFARAYAQWVGLRGSKQIHKEVHEYGGQWREHGYHAQWTDEDFAPIAKEFDRLFAGRRLLRVRSRS